jgi:hydroxymethylbilane synthase
MSGHLKIATRKSALAMWQANHVRSLLEQAHAGLSVELVPIVTRGDRILDRPLAAIGGKGLFLKELEHALLDGDADLAVHSMKDVPAEMTPGLTLDVVLPRATPFDAWISRDGSSVDDMPPGSRVGTSSLRRRCQLLATYPELDVVDLRGNVDTRLRKLAEGEFDAIILACAGLERLGFDGQITQVLGAPDWLPAATQGIIGLQCRQADERVLGLIGPLHDVAAGIQARAERIVAAMLEGSCQVPLAVFAELRDSEVSVSALVGTPDGERLIRASQSGSHTDAERIAELVAKRLLQQGAAEIIQSLQDG